MLLGNHEWVQYHERIEPADYAQLRHHFTAEDVKTLRTVGERIESEGYPDGRERA